MLWERHMAQNQLNASDKATMRTLPIDSSSHLFGAQHPRVADIIKSRKEERRPTMTVSVDPGLVFKQQQAKSSGGKSKGGGKGKSSKPKHQQKQAQKDKPASKESVPPAKESARPAEKSAAAAGSKGKKPWKGRKKPSSQ